MLNIIKSIIANYYWQAALRHMGTSSPGLALGAIKQSVKNEPNEKFLPRYLVLQGELELALGREKKALESFEAAKKIIKKYPEYWRSEEQRDIPQRLDGALKNMEKN